MVASAQMMRTFDTNSEALIPGQVVSELIDSDGGFCVRDSYLEEIGDGETLIARLCDGCWKPVLVLDPMEG
ncbi:unnamed protein product [Prunus armeniaca]